MDSTVPNRSTVIEGVGDEIVYGIALMVGFVFPLSLMIINSRLRQQQLQLIHPDNAANVEQARQRVQSQRPHQTWPSSETQHLNRPRGRDATCPVCLATATFAIETNCGHLFCGQCITTYWMHGRWLGAVSCPVCRQQVTILLRCFSDEEQNTELPEKQEIIDKINDYNRRFSGEPRPLLDYIRDMPTLLRHAFTHFFSVGGLIWMFRLRVVVCFIAALLYFISPLDIIPEAAFGLLGFLDDLFILLLLAIYITVIYRRVVEERAQGEQENT